MAGVPMRVVLVDDHVLVREGLQLLLERDGRAEVVAVAGDPQDALRCVRLKQPDVVVLDVELGEADGLALVPEVKRAAPGVCVAVLTMHADPLIARAALAAGAGCFVRKEAASSDLIKALTACREGRSYVDPEVGARLVAAERPENPAALTPRELDVLRLLALGHTNAEIAEQLTISARTVESHRSRVQQKTGVTARSGLVRFAYEHGVLP